MKLANLTGCVGVLGFLGLVFGQAPAVDPTGGWGATLGNLGQSAAVIVMALIGVSYMRGRDSDQRTHDTERDSKILAALGDFKDHLESATTENRRIADGLTRVMSEVVVTMKSLEKTVDANQRAFESFKLVVYQTFQQLGHNPGGGEGQSGPFGQRPSQP